MREKLKHTQEFKIENLTEELQQMQIDDGEGDAEDATTKKKEFVKTVKKTMKKDFDNEEVEGELVIDALKRKKIPRLDEDSSKRGTYQVRGKRDFKAKEKAIPSDDDEEEEDTVQMKSEFS